MQIRTKIQKYIYHVQYTGTNIVPFYKVSLSVAGKAIGRQFKTLKQAREFLRVINSIPVSTSQHLVAIENNSKLFDSIDKLKAGEFIEYILTSGKEKSYVRSIIRNRYGNMKNFIRVFSQSSVKYYILKIR